MSDVLAEVLPLGKLRLVPGVQYRVLQEFTDDSGALHHVGERWAYLGFEQPKMYPGYVVHGLQSNGGKLAFRLCWASRGQTEVVQFFEKYVTGPIVPTGSVIDRLSSGGVAAFERVRHWIEPLPQDSNALLELIQSRRGNASIVADKDGPQQPAIDLTKLLHEFEVALRGFDA